ncbi:MAG: flavin reductase [Bacteroidota bacterium]|nr:flavin reductase [Bacteroidota bacterium]
MNAEADMVRWTREDLDAWPSRKRARTINSVSGFKSATLVGSADPEGVHNLSVVSSVVHLGSSPAQMGMVLRPPGDDAHTYKNLTATGQCTFNHIGVAWVGQAHQCSARYPAEVSEFEAVGLSPCGVEGTWKAPAVSKARVRMGLTLTEDMVLPNRCHFMVLDVQWVEVDARAVAEDGYVDLGRAGTTAISGLDGYHDTTHLGRFSYAKVGKEVAVLTDVMAGWNDL